MRKVIAATILIILCVASAKASRPWINAFFLDTDSILRVRANPCDSIVSITHPDSGGTCNSLTINTADGATTTLPLSSVTDVEVGSNIPSVYIYTEWGAAVESKTEYLNATITIVPEGDMAALSPTAVKIKGRGNTSWGFPKRPYRLKFDKKTSITGLTKAKSYTLIANYIDNCLMHNAIAFKAAQLLGMPYTNHSVPVNLWINDDYHGSYMLSEKIGINAGSVDIDENTGMLFEIDMNYDEDFKFTTPIYSLPVMVNAPDLTELFDYTADAQAYLAKWQADFEAMERAVAAGDSLGSIIDLESAANYMIVYVLSLNYEIINPKSQFMYKTSLTDKYHFGPVWDFDWSFTFHTGEYPDCYENPLLTAESTANDFFTAVVDSPGFMEVFNERWEYFDTHCSQALMDYIDDYAAQIRVSAYQNGELYPQATILPMCVSTETFDDNYKILRTWMEERLRYMRTAPRHGLY